MKKRNLHLHEQQVRPPRIIFYPLCALATATWMTDWGRQQTAAPPRWRGFQSVASQVFDPPGVRGTGGALQCANVEAGKKNPAIVPGPRSDDLHSP
jgi:hypothetical protein